MISIFYESCLEFVVSGKKKKKSKLEEKKKKKP